MVITRRQLLWGMAALLGAAASGHGLVRGVTLPVTGLATGATGAGATLGSMTMTIRADTTALRTALLEGEMALDRAVGPDVTAWAMYRIGDGDNVEFVRAMRTLDNLTVTNEDLQAALEFGRACGAVTEIIKNGVQAFDQLRFFTAPDPGAITEFVGALHGYVDAYNGHFGKPRPYQAGRRYRGYTRTIHRGRYRPAIASG